MSIFYRDKTIFAIEIGTSKVICAAGRIGDDGRLTFLGVGESVSCGVRKGEVVDPATAHASVRDAIAQVESKTGVAVTEVYMSLSAAHLVSVLQRGRKDIVSENRLISLQDVHEVQRAAEDIALARDRLHVATLLKTFRIDGSEDLPNPIGMAGESLEGEFLVVHGINSRLRNVISRVTDLQIDVSAYQLSPVASADAVLTEEQKKLGALVIDLGGGLTHYCAYHNGQIEKLGVLGVGGDHLTQDISKSFNLPARISEDLKQKDGAAHLEKLHQNDVITLRPSMGFAGKNIYTENLVDVISSRMEETLMIVRDEVGPGLVSQLGAGIILTGGGARTSGLDVLARRVFKCPVTIQGLHDLPGNVEDLSRPELSTVIGTLKYGHRKSLQEMANRSLGSVVSRIFQKVRLML